MKSSKIPIMYGIGAIIYAWFILLFPLLLRHSGKNPLLAGITYYQDIVRGPYFLHQYILSFVSPDMYLIFSIALGFIVACMAYALLKRIGFSDQNSLFGFILLVSLPSFIFMSVSDLQVLLSFTLGITGIYTFISLRNTLFSLFLLAFAVIIDPFALIFFGMVLLVYLEFTPYRYKDGSYVLSTMAIVGFAAHVYVFLTTGIFLDFTTKFTGLLPDLGSEHGIGIFALVLALIGIFASYTQRRKLSAAYVGLLILLVGAVSYQSASIYLAIGLSIFSLVGISYVVSRNWQLLILRDYAFILIACGILFSAVSFATEYANQGPQQELVDGLSFADKLTFEGTLLTDPSRSYWVSYWTHAETPGSQQGFYSTEAIGSIEEVLQSRNIDFLRNSFDTYNIDFILIDSEMTFGLTWNSRSGLWYALRNNETFKKIYGRSGVEVWENLYR